MRKNINLKVRGINDLEKIKKVIDSNKNSFFIDEKLNQISFDELIESVKTETKKCMIINKNLKLFTGANNIKMIDVDLIIINDLLMF
jgi:hypothetical protein